MGSRVLFGSQAGAIAAAAVLIAFAVIVASARTAPEAVAAPRALAEDRPNIVVIETDDQTADSMRFMENVNRLLVRQGVRFDNSYASYPLCRPSRATFLTGQYAHNHGVPRERAAARRLYRARPLEHASDLAPAGRLLHRARRQVPERLRQPGDPERPRPRGGASGATTSTAVPRPGR